MNIPNDMNNAVTDPFDEPLEDSLILNDTFFAAARDVITVDGMEYSFLSNRSIIPRPDEPY